MGVCALRGASFMEERGGEGKGGEGKGGEGLID